jgi:GNAT superfamily N-acetyltransferase
MEEIASMLEHLNMIFHMIWESLTQGKLMDILQDQIWNRKVAIPVEMDLTKLSSQTDLFKGLEDSYFTELKLEKLQGRDWSFTLPSRRYKAIRNLKRGLRGFGLIKDSKVVGDIWCIAPTEANKPVHHPELDMLGIHAKENEVYAFDMLIDPDYRGKNLAVPIQRALQLALKAEGYPLIYGFYWQDNIPAMWMHRSLKFRELPKRWVSRFFLIKRFGPLQTIQNAQEKPSATTINNKS